MLINRIPKKFSLDPIKDIQILTPMNKLILGAHALNNKIQNIFHSNKPYLSHGSTKFMVGDKVIQKSNDYQKEIFNGDIGFISSINCDENSLTVRFDNKEVEYDTHDLDDLSLAYAITIHKSQGSEFPAVIIPFSSQHFMMLQKKLLYTAMTRGKKLVILIGEPRAIAMALGSKIM